MQRKDFKIIAKTLAAVKPANRTAAQQWRKDCNALAIVFQATSSNFKITLFLEACGAQPVDLGNAQ